MIRAKMLSSDRERSDRKQTRAKRTPNFGSMPGDWANSIFRLESTR
jgi:hypothetical protein